jgi:hypothetical protein
VVHFLYAKAGKYRVQINTLGEGSDIGPRLAGLTDDDIEAVAHYFDSVQVN